MAKFFGFPDPVNETSARIVATGVVAMGSHFLLTRNGLVLAVLTYGFAARVLTGPRFSPLGRIATQVITPRLAGPHRFVPGPPKRFAQGVGLAFTATASVLFLAGLGSAAVACIAALVCAAALEAFVGYCLGCAVFGVLVRRGLVPTSVCERCSDLSLRRAAVAD